MEDLYLEEMEAPCRDFVLAVPGKSRAMVHRPLAGLHPSPSRPVPRRLRSVACGFPDRRLRVSLQVAQLRRGG